MEKVAIPSRRGLFRGRLSTKPAMRLPWVISEAVFKDNCSQCQDCINVCETKIIVRDSHGYPKVDFSLGECSFCQKCISSCQQPLFLADKTNPAWPDTLTISDNCLAKNNIYCQSCSDICEAEAIKFSFINSSIPTPEIDVTSCTQCGACVATCPQNSLSFQPPVNEINHE